MSSDEDLGRRFVISDDDQLALCAVCSEMYGDKVQFCTECKHNADDPGCYCTFVHPRCAEKIMTGNRRINCTSCELQYSVSYKGVIFEDHVLRNMTETFACCMPKGYRRSLTNFLIAKNIVYSTLSLVLLIIYANVAAKAHSNAQLIGLELLHVSALILFLLAYVASTNSALKYVVMFGSVRRAKRQQIAEAFVVVLLIAAALSSAPSFRTLLDVDTLYGVYTVLTIGILIPALGILLLRDKYRVRKSMASVKMMITDWQ